MTHATGAHRGPVGFANWLTPVLLVLMHLALSGCAGAGAGSTALGSMLNPNAAAQTRQLADVLAEIDTTPLPNDIDAALSAELKAELKRVLKARGTSQIAIAPPSGQKNAVQDLEVAFPPGSNYRLEWTYVNVGDYNQDKLVSVNDLTPIGQHYAKSTESADWESAKVADGDNNGLITVSDITPIGQNYNAMLAGYHVQRADSADGPWATVYTVDFSEADDNAPRRFMYLFTTLDSAYYRVVPTDGSTDGVASNVVLTPGPPVAPEITAVSPLSGISGEATVFSATVTGSEPLNYSWDFGGGATPNTSTESEPEVTLGAINTYYATLTVSNASGDDEFNFTLDVVGEFAKPVVTDVDPRGGITGTKITITPTYTCEGPPSYHWGFGDAATPSELTTETATITLGEPGEYECSFILGNPSYTTFATVYAFTLSVWEPGHPPEITDVTPREGYSGQAITVYPVLAANGTPSFSWNFGGGATPNTSTLENPEIALGNYGAYSGSLTVDNEFGSDTFPFTLTVLNPQGPPQIHWVSPCVGRMGTDLEIAAYITGTEPFTYSWNFGGGATPNASTADSPTIELGDYGGYEAKLVVTNGEGHDTYKFVLYSVDNTGIWDAILALPRILQAIPGESVPITAYCSATNQAFSAGIGARISFPTGCAYVPESFNAGVPGGDPAAVDGPVWSEVAPEYLLVPEETNLQELVDLGGGRSATDFWIQTFNGTAIWHATGELFTFDIKINENASDGDEINLSFERWNSELGEFATYYADPGGSQRIWENYTNEIIPPIIVIRPVFTLIDPPATGSGTPADPYEVGNGADYHFQVTSTTLGDLTTSSKTSYHVSPAEAAAFSDGLLTVSSTYGEPFFASIDYDGYYSQVWYFTIEGGSTRPNDSLAAIPQQTMVAYGTDVTVVVAANATAYPFQYLNGCGVTMETGNDYVAGSLNVGSPGGAQKDADGVWAAIAPLDILLPYDWQIVGSDIGGGRQRIDFNVIPIGGTQLTFATGDLFNFQLHVTSNVTLGFQEFETVKRTYYSDGDATEYNWGNITNNYSDVPNSITVIPPP
ncbi:PKD domain-containing protein [bacterium]|nr:PKD domain-containing protein [bacterium]